MRIKVHGMYDHFPNHHPVDGEPYINCYNDYRVKDKKIESNSVALLIEPRSIQPDIYQWMEQNYEKFKIVFTHDSTLLSCLPNAKLILWGGVWSWADDNIRYNKTKNISFACADKEMCIQHIRRKQLCEELESKIDCMGTYNGGQFISTEQIYKDYRFSVCIENYRDDFWFTEKICNAFANKCVPIYYGAREIDRFFDKRGIIVVRDLNELPRTIDNILYDPVWDYGHRNQAIDRNYQLVKTFENFEQWFFSRYGSVLDDLYREA